ncbi:hypothetical protein FACS1894211_04080 [Clostridia bacterium]|nr:hypothetical protein FACS1894211_04080 [Clostridia bacterium]
MKKLVIRVVTLCLCAMLAFSAFACGKTDDPDPGSAVTVTEFNVDQTKKFTEIGELYVIPNVTAKGSDDKTYAPEVSVKDPKAAAVTVTNKRFTPNVVGDYVVTYTVPIGEGGSTSKSYTLECYDETAPVIHGIGKYNITGLNETFDIRTITVEDNSGETITPVITVTYGDGAVEPVDGIVTFDQFGVYTIHVDAEDSSGNSTDQDCYVTTKFSFEDEFMPSYEHYSAEISDEYAWKGGHSMKVGVFDNEITNFYDRTMLGDDVNVLGDYNRLSFWFLLGTPEGYTPTDLIIAQYKPDSIFEYGLTMYDQDGKIVAPGYGNHLHFTAGKWYRLVVEMDNPTAPYLPITNLSDLQLVWAIWGGSNGGRPGSGQLCKMFIDEIRVFKDTDADDEEYYVAPVLDYEKGTKIGNLGGISNAAILSTVTAANYGWSTGNAKADFKLSHGSMASPVAYTAETLGDAVASSGLLINGWQFGLLANDSVIYAVRAKDRIFVEIDKWNNSGANAIDGWIEAITIQVIVENAQSVRKTVYNETVPAGDRTVEGAALFYPPAVLLEAGETMYYVLTVGNNDRSGSFLPVISLYNAVEK